MCGCGWWVTGECDWLDVALGVGFRRGDASSLKWLGALPRLGSEMAARQGGASEVTGESALIATCFCTVFGKWGAGRPVTRGTSCPGSELCLSQAGLQPPDGLVPLRSGGPVDLGQTIVCPGRV